MFRTGSAEILYQMRLTRVVQLAIVCGYIRFKIAMLRYDLDEDDQIVGME